MLNPTRFTLFTFIALLSVGLINTAAVAQVTSPLLTINFEDIEANFKDITVDTIIVHSEAVTTKLQAAQELVPYFHGGIDGSQGNGKYTNNTSPLVTFNDTTQRWETVLNKAFGCFAIGKSVRCFNGAGPGGTDFNDTAESPKENDINLLGIPAGKRGKTYDFESVFRAVSNVTFDDFQPESKLTGLVFDTTYTITKRFQPAYDFFIAKKDDKYWVKCKAAYRGPDIKKVATIKGDETKEETERKDKLIEGAKEVDRFNDRHQSWVYEISSWTAESMTKKFDDLVEDAITASHILVSYEGADNSEVKGRTKEQAKKKAEELLAKVRAEPDKFAELATQNSDGPSKDKGGDLGEFDRDTMEKPFTEVAFKLKPGEISDVVETKFGFHVIKRTK